MFVSCPFFCLFYFFGFKSYQFNHYFCGCGACDFCELEIVPIQ